MALRLRQADLPTEPVVALMSPEHRFAIGAGILIAPLLAGLLGFLVDWWIYGTEVPQRLTKLISLSSGELPRHLKWLRRENWLTDDNHLTEGGRKVVAAGTLIAGSVPVYFLLDPRPLTLAVETVAVAAAVPLAFHFLPDDRDKIHGFNERIALFLSVLVAAGAGAILAENFGTPTFDETVITLQSQLEIGGADQSAVGGAYITSTEHAVVISPSCERVLAVPRTQIALIRVGPDRVARESCQ